MKNTELKKDDHYELKTIESWDALLREYQGLRNPEQWKGWIYRGEGDVAYPISTSLERALDRFGIPLDDKERKALEIEYNLLRHFRRRLHHYTTDIPHKKDTVEWLALMQHYGAPTRLLDWTYSFWVAVYFAIESAGDKGCRVWALRMEKFDQEAHIRGMLKASNRAINKFRKEIEQSMAGSIIDEPWLEQNAIVEYLLKKPKSLAFTVSSFRQNERLTIQQGVFLMPGDISKSFEHNLMAHPELHKNLIKFEFNFKDKNHSIKLKNEILLHLYRMNINRASLFPGLAGFAESLKTRLASPQLMRGFGSQR